MFMHDMHSLHACLEGQKSGKPGVVMRWPHLDHIGVCSVFPSGGIGKTLLLKYGFE